MSRYNKVVWSEGLFLLPQLFQQQERYLEHVAHARALPLLEFFWGCSQLEMDSNSLPLGKVALRTVSGLFPDGTPFDAPSQAPLPSPLAITAAHAEQVIYLTLPMRLPQVDEVCFDDAQGRSQARYGTFETDVADINSIGMDPQTLQLARLRLVLVAEQDVADNVMGIAVARVLSVGGNGEVRLDPNFVPTCNRCTASEKLTNWLTELHSLVHLRAEALAQALVGAGADGTVPEIADYLLLQTLNRYEPLLRHLVHSGGGNPEGLYTLLLSLAGEMSTFLRFHTRRPEVMPPYQHDKPGLSLHPLVDELRLLLNIVVERGAQRIPLQNQQHGGYLAVLAPGEAESFSALVLGVSARMPRDVLQQEFLTKSKVGPSEHLAQLVRSHVPGIALQFLPLAPRQMPFTAGAVYFELRREGGLWEKVRESGGLGIHIAGEFAGLHLELWGIRER